MNFTVVSRYASSEASFSEFAQMASWSIAVPSSFQSIAVKSSAVYSSPVSGFSASSSCAYSL